MIGKAIGRYRIVEQLGSGGMGDVYKAEDTSLGRPVALKFLAAHLLHDAEAKQRFLREARASAALHHPNVCTVYEVGEEGGATFLAMAYLEGESLEERIKQGPLPLKDALEIGRQVAEGLEAAHAKGIVHRDIKPANVMVDGSGHATILDFGLARLAEASKLTRPDQTVGTTAYMSPEQIQGAEVDDRTDVWALGCVLYEMVAGSRPFPGQYDQALAFEICNEDPEPLTGVRAGVPMELEVFVAKALAKEASERYQSVGEFGSDLRSLSRRLESGRAGQSVARSPAAVARPDDASPARERWAWVAAGALGLLNLVLLFLLLAPDKTSSISERPVKFEVELPEGVLGYFVELSPDGRYLAYTLRNRGRDQLFVHDLETNQSRALADLVQIAAGRTQPMWSPDSRALAYFSGRQIKKISPEGGISRTILEDTEGRRGAWGEDGTIFFFSSTVDGDLYRASESSARAVRVTNRGSEEGEPLHATWPHFLPGGDRFFYRDQESRLIAATVDLSHTQEVMHSTVDRAIYAPDGALVFLRGKDLFGQCFELANYAVCGDPIPLDHGVRSVPGTGMASFSVSRNGRLAYAVGSPTSRLYWFDRQGRRERALDAEVDDRVPFRLSPDGTRIAASHENKASGRLELWIHESGRNAPVSVAMPDGHHFGGSWSPDGRRLISSIGSGAPPNPYLLSLDQQTEWQRIDFTVRDDRYSTRVIGDWASDGVHVLFTNDDIEGSGDDLWVLDLDQQKASELVVEAGHQREGRISPDARWFAYESTELEDTQIWVAPFRPSAGQPARSERTRVSTMGGAFPVWSRDGRELFYRRTDGMLMAVPVTLGDAAQLGSPEELFEIDGRFDVHPDGRFLVAMKDDARNRVTVVLNWTALLRDD